MKILIVEDEVKLALAMKRGLETQHHTVDIEHNGETGLEVASSNGYDAIILDVMLPNLSGIEICTQLRQQKILTPILMLTAKGQIQDKVTGLDSGADDYLVKPFSFEELFSRLRALNRRSSNTHSTVLTYKDLVLDPTSFKVTRDNREIYLSPKEFALLEYFLRHPNRVVSKEQIINQVWNYDTEILPSTIEVHIKNLRDKVDKPFNRPLIKTVRGFGYEISH